MVDLIPMRGQLAQIIPDWIAAAPVECVPGSGIPYMGKVAIVLTRENLAVVTGDRAIIHTIFYESLIRLREIEFKGLVIERDGVLVAPNETFGVEFVHKGAGNFERTIKVLTRSANNARALIDTVSKATTDYLDANARSSSIILRGQE